MLALLQIDNVTLPDTFWEDLRAEQQTALAPWLERLVEQGLADGRAQLGLVKAAPELQMQIDWNLVNQNALAWAQTYTYDLVGGITQTTREKLQTVIGDWLQAGEAFPELRARVQSIFDDPKRAELIAVTETTRAIAEGNTQAWQAANVWGREWRTARDELVCPVCGPLHQQRAMTGQAFQGAIQNPPAHPNCRCGVVPVVKPERSPAPGVEQERRIVAGRERTFNVVPLGERTRLLVPIDLDPAHQIWTRETMTAALGEARQTLPEPLRDVIPEIVLVDTRDRRQEDLIAERLGYAPDPEKNRLMASTDPVTGRITIYRNADLRDDPEWQGAEADLREEIGHSLAVHLFGSGEPPQEWQTAMAQDGNALGHNATEDWAQAVALWIQTGNLAQYPAREQFLRRLGFGTIKVIQF